MLLKYPVSLELIFSRRGTDEHKRTNNFGGGALYQHS